MSNNILNSPKKGYYRDNLADKKNAGAPDGRVERNRPSAHQPIPGVGAASENVELAVQFRLPRVGPNQAFVTMARGMLEKATVHKELLVTRGMSETLLADITAAIEEFEQTLEATRAGRREPVGASADLRAVMAEISEQVKVLDGIVRYRFGDNAELMGAWASAHNVAGPFRSRTEPAGGGETPGTEKAA
jgi:hypothetical protein